MNASVRDLLEFLDRSPTPYHAIAECRRRLEACGFRRLEEHDGWSLAADDHAYVTRGAATLAAFVVGNRPSAEVGFRVIGAHTDSPNLRVKPQPDLRANGYRQLAVEPYGGVLLYTWLDRDLSLAGRVSYLEEGAPRSTLVDFERPILRIPSLAIHLQREIREDGLTLNAQTQLNPVLGLDAPGGLPEMLAERLSSDSGVRIERRDILAFDLMAYETTPAAVGGVDHELVCASRLDNLASCHAALSALIRSADLRAPQTRAIVLFDHEEVGSRSATGADGPFLGEVLERVVLAVGGGTEDVARGVSRSLLVSTDMAHAVHPNFADRHEPGHRPVIGGGPTIKRNVNQAYATDSTTAAHFAAICRRHEIAIQNFIARSDMACGSTIGPISAARVGIPTVDVGNPMLAMHSCRETAGAADVEPMIRALTAVLGDAP